MRKSIHTDERAVFVKRLKKARLEAGLTQAEVANKLVCSQSWVSKIELGELRVEAIWLNRLAKLYGKSVDYFPAWYSSIGNEALLSRFKELVVP